MLAIVSEIVNIAHYIHMYTYIQYHIRGVDWKKREAKAIQQRSRDRSKEIQMLSNSIPKQIGAKTENQRAHCWMGRLDLRWQQKAGESRRSASRRCETQPKQDENKDSNIGIVSRPLVFTAQPWITKSRHTNLFFSFGAANFSSKFLSSFPHDNT